MTVIEVHVGSARRNLTTWWPKKPQPPMTRAAPICGPWGVVSTRSNGEFDISEVQVSVADVAGDGIDASGDDSCLIVVFWSGRWSAMVEGSCVVAIEAFWGVDVCVYMKRQRKVTKSDKK